MEITSQSLIDMHQRTIDSWKKKIEDDEALIDTLEKTYGSLSDAKKKTKKVSEWSQELQALVTHGTSAVSGTIKKAVDRLERGLRETKEAQEKIDELIKKQTQHNSRLNESRRITSFSNGGSKISKEKKVKNKKVLSQKNKKSKRK